MRSLSQISAPLLPTRNDSPRSYARRRRDRVTSGLTVLCLFKHDESATEIFVSHNDDPLAAVWISKQPLPIDPRFSGRFVVVTLTKQMAQEKSLAVFPILDFDKYLPEERKQLQAAIDAAWRARTRHRSAAGYTTSSMGHMGRNSWA